MKKLLTSLLIVAFILVGCSNDQKETNKPSNDVEVTYVGESKKYEPYKSTVKVIKKGDQIISIEFDELYEGIKSKKEDSKKGTYGNNYPAGPWYKQIGSLEEYVLQNNKFPKLKDGKDVDAVTSATLNLSGFEDAFNNLKNTK